MRLSMWPFAAAALTAAWLLPASGINAQTPSPSPGMSGQSTNISEQKLDAAANAIERVSAIKQGYQQRMEAAPPSDRGRLADEASDEMVKAVAEQGLSVDEYNSIIEVAQNDPVVHDKIVQRLRAKK